jgi:hypothetical protein
MNNEKLSLYEECAECEQLEDACPACARRIHEGWHEAGLWWVRAEECHPGCPGRAEHPVPPLKSVEEIETERRAEQKAHTIRVPGTRPAPKE